MRRRDPFLIVVDPVRQSAHGPPAINTLFLDIGGVLLTNGWDTDLRKQTAQHFGLVYEEIYHRHHVTYDIYEEGKMTLDGDLWQIVFYEPRPFTPEVSRPTCSNKPSRTRIRSTW